MKKLFILLIFSVLSLLVSDECFAQFSDISIGKYSIESIRPESFSSVKGAVMLEVANAGVGFTVSEISGTVYKDGTPFIMGQASNFHVSPDSQKLVVSGRASLCQDATLWSVLGLLFFDPEDYAVDIRLKVTTDSGAVRIIEKKRLPVEVLLKIK